MKRREAEKLLGGYAMGILTEAEQRVLFGAALERQEVFDALMDEEALRELLADPAARQHLLSILSEPDAAKVRPFWRKPAVLGLAASLFLVVTTSLVLRRQPVATLRTNLPETAKLEPEPLMDQAAKVVPPEAPSVAKPQARKADETARRVVPPVSKQIPVPTEALGENYASTAAKAAPPADLEKGFQATESVALGAAAPSPAMTKRAKAATGLAETSRAETGRTEAKKEEADAAPAGSDRFSRTLQRLPDGRYRLTVNWEGDGHVYLLRRAGASVSEIAPTTSTVKAQRRTSVFEFALEPGQVLDLYLRPRSETDPATLPSSDDGEGQWQRIVPESTGP